MQQFIQWGGLTPDELRARQQREMLEAWELKQLNEALARESRVLTGVGTNGTSGPTPVTLAFEISSESGTNVLLQIGTKVGKTVDVTVEWDAVGIVSAGSISQTIAPSTTWSPSIDLAAADTNVPFRIILSDSSAIQLLTWTASNDDAQINEYQIWTAPTNFSALTGTNSIQFEFQGVSELDISNFEGAQFSWVNDVTITSANLTNVNASFVQFQNCTSLSTLTLTGLTYGNNVDGGYELDFYGCALTQATVNALLIAAVASGYENGIIDISGGTNAVFNGAGQTAYTTLIDRGWNIIDNVPPITGSGPISG